MAKILRAGWLLRFSRYSETAAQSRQYHISLGDAAGIAISGSEAEAFFKVHPGTEQAHDLNRQSNERGYNNPQLEYAHSPLVRLDSTPF